MGERAGGSMGLGWLSRGAGVRNFPLAHGSHSWQPGHGLYSGVITRGARPLDHRARTRDGVSSQLAGHPGAVASAACCRAGGPMQHPSRIE